MKKVFIISLMLGLSLPLLLGAYKTQSSDTIQPTVLVTPLSYWSDIGDLTAGQASFPVDDRSYSAVWTDANVPDANNIEWDVPNDVTGVFFRALADANEDAYVVEMWVSAGATTRDGVEDHFTLGAILTLTGGAQAGPSSNVFIDTIAVTASTGVLPSGTVLDSGNDRIAMYRLDLQGWKKVVFIATTFEAATTLQFDARWY